jgi:hypothetical protein
LDTVDIQIQKKETRTDLERLAECITKKTSLEVSSSPGQTQPEITGPTSERHLSTSQQPEFTKKSTVVTVESNRDQYLNIEIGKTGRDAYDALINFAIAFCGNLSDTEEKTRKDTEEKTRKDTEEKTRKDTEEKTRKDKEEKTRKDTEDFARIEADKGRLAALAAEKERIEDERITIEYEKIQAAEKTRGEQSRLAAERMANQRRTQAEFDAEMKVHEEENLRLEQELALAEQEEKLKAELANEKLLLEEEKKNYELEAQIRREAEETANIAADLANKISHERQQNAILEAKRQVMLKKEQ